MQLGGPLPSVGTGPDTWKNRAASRFSGFFSSSAGAGPFKVTLVVVCQPCLKKVQKLKDGQTKKG